MKNECFVFQVGEGVLVENQIPQGNKQTADLYISETMMLSSASPKPKSPITCQRNSPKYTNSMADLAPANFVNQSVNSV